MFTVIGCGNTNRSDDGVGSYVATSLMRHFARAPNPAVRIFDAGTCGIEVMFAARSATQLVIVDAGETGSVPGAIFRVPGHELESLHQPVYSLHDFRWDHALFAGRKIFREQFPKDVTVFLIEAKELGLGLALSPPVLRAAEEVVHTICQMIEAESINNSINNSIKTTDAAHAPTPPA